jgi:hypothetical protein
MPDCQHEEFDAFVAVNRLEDTGTFSADITIRCRQCQMPFSFVGVERGLSSARPMISVDGTELRAPIEPGPRAVPLSGTIVFEMPSNPMRES